MIRSIIQKNPENKFTPTQLKKVLQSNMATFKLFSSIELDRFLLFLISVDVLSTAYTHYRTITGYEITTRWLVCGSLTKPPATANYQMINSHLISSKNIKDAIAVDKARIEEKMVLFLKKKATVLQIKTFEVMPPNIVRRIINECPSDKVEFDKITDPLDLSHYFNEIFECFH